ncbi:gephyrin-like molybdotransferase Glp [uncultured Cohaesibacter sp.]|uniref:molybdopterin molybdotransferase MoeA n=1 Tax=uncultured Cohaesibacter sp. TaxID=1002546 RepID=UPI00292EB8E1|nr:gephyrin-like molybdotransferase Glp [uncultured Cohaesibacter sp.]
MTQKKAPKTGKKPLMEVEDALSKILAGLSALDRTETVDLMAGRGRVLARDVVATTNAPPEDNSAMDGYAVRCDSLMSDASRLSLPVLQRIAAGDVGVPMEPNSAARIFTGAAVPAGAQSVVIQEKCEEKDGVVTFKTPVKPGDNIRRIGEDISVGDVAVRAGTRLAPSHLAMAASIGVGTLTVFKPVKVAILSTGDELTDPGQPLGQGKIYNSNRYALNGLLEQLGCEVVDMGWAEDDLETIKQKLEKSADAADLILTTGGVSVGEEDHVKAAIEALGDLEIWSLNIKPGKPVAYGHVKNTIFVGLPGNPVSTYVTFLLIAGPVIRKLQGQAETVKPVWCLPAGFERSKPGKRREYIRVKAVVGEDGKMELHSFSRQGSAIMNSVCWADGLAKIPEDTLVNKGDMLDFLPFDQLMN